MESREKSRDEERNRLEESSRNPRARPKGDGATRQAEARSKRQRDETVPGWDGGTPSTTPGGAAGKM
jgi:hypothetical protein